MLFERIISEGLAHYSYIIGDGTEAAVIDPRRDADAYPVIAGREGMRITRILETHRNEDYIVGSRELAAMTGAEIWHADRQWPYRYGRAVEDGQEWMIGRLRLAALHTPGHTPGSMSYLLHDPDGAAWMLFCGDVLFAGEVGRVDLLGKEKLREMAGLLYDSLFHRILPLGDGVILCPAHGSGSVCGDNIGERLWTTIGLERRLNPRLRHAERAAFVEEVARDLPRPSYFTRMERLNVEGAPLLRDLPAAQLLAPDEFERLLPEAEVVDTREAIPFAAAHIPGALSLWLAGLPAFAGWFLPYDRPLLLVGEEQEREAQVRSLRRLGYDQLPGVLAGGLQAWQEAGRESCAVELVTVQELRRRLTGGETPWILDVRGPDELAAAGELAGSHNVPLPALARRMEDIPRDRRILVLCGSGHRSMIAASLLVKAGWREVAVIAGGMTAWLAAGYPVERETAAAPL